VNSPILIRAVLELAVFLGTSNDEIVDPDAAVSQLETLAWMLKDVDADGRKQIISCAREMARERERSGDITCAEFLFSFCENLGLTAC
jgi:hypothetical protein